MADRREERIKKNVLARLADGSMYSFDFEFIKRISYENCMLNKYSDNPFYHYHRGSRNNVEPDEHIEIMFNGGITCKNRLISDRIEEFPMLFLQTIGENHDNYLLYPNVLVNIDECDNIIKNWVINFIDYFLSKSEYDYIIAKRYLSLWGKSNALDRLVKKHQIEDIAITFIR